MLVAARRFHIGVVARVRARLMSAMPQIAAQKRKSPKVRVGFERGLPDDSCDSSAWISSVRWGRVLTSVSGQSFGEMRDGFLYSRDADRDSERGHRKARRLCAYNAVMMGHTMRNIRRDQESELGADTRLPHHG